MSRINHRFIAILVGAALLVAGLSTTHRANAATCAAIHDIQGAGHLSPCAGQTVTAVPGIVTAYYYSGSTTAKGFYMQASDASIDADPKTSEGILVFSTTAAATVAVGDAVTVNGKISEYRPGGSTSGGLTITEFGSAVTVTKVSSGNALPAAIVVGVGGRAIPAKIENDATCTNVETCTSFDPTVSAIDLWESLEGMRVTENNAVVVGPTNQYNETVIAPDNGAGIATRTPRGGALVIDYTNFNAQRVFIYPDILKGSGGSAPTPMNVGDTLATVNGIVDYAFGNFNIELTSQVTPVSGGLTQAVATAQTTNQLAIATFNVENFNIATDPPAKVTKLGALIVNNLKSPDIVTVEEVQDNTGPTDDGVVASGQNWNALINAITTAGGPTYQYTEIDPVDKQDGGQPGGNIRQGFLYNPARVTLVSRAGGNSTNANSVVCNNGMAQLQYSPGRIDPTNTAWSSSRKPLAAEFTFNGKTVIVVGNHFNSKGGDTPLFGFTQPINEVTSAQRVNQAISVNNFVTQITTCQSAANVVVLGDLNDYQFSTPITTLTGTVLDNLMLTLPVNQRYSYDFEGNSEVLDQILISKNLTATASAQYEVVHINAEFFNGTLTGSVRVSDHDPSVTRLTIAPSAVADTIGIYRPSNNTFYLKYANSTGYADLTIQYGSGTQLLPVSGDWTGKGYTSIGTYDPTSGLFALRNTNTAGTPDIFLTLGIAGDRPLAGWWTSTATHSGVGVFRPTNGLIYLKNELTSGYADFTMVLGIPGDVGLSGDWNGDGVDSPGVYRPSYTRFYLTNQVINGNAYGQYEAQLGLPGDVPVSGDWTAQGHSGIGVFRPANGLTYLKNALNTGYADNEFVYGSPNDLPVAGYWRAPSGSFVPLNTAANNVVVIDPVQAPGIKPTLVPTPAGESGVDG